MTSQLSSSHDVPADSSGEEGSGREGRAAIEPLDPQLTSIQPGGGVCMRLELLWGHARRGILKTFFPGYVRRMRELRRGAGGACPHEVLDPRDIKFYRNQPGAYWWADDDDPFRWRDRLPLVRYGLAEAFLLTSLFLGLAVLAALWQWWAALPFAVLALLIVWFFRNPRREAPAAPGLVISPADGRVVSITEIAHDPFVGGPAVEIGIFLSVFDVHINRVPVAARILGMTYRRGKFLNALLPASVRENEQLAVRMEELEPPFRRFIVRQIAGAIARRIVCAVAPGEEIPRGGVFGMIKLGSRTEIVMPRDELLTIVAKRGDVVRAGATVLARYDSPPGVS